MNDYELICVLNPQLEQEKIDSIIEKTEKKIASSGGEVVKVDRWGKKKLAFEFSRYKGVKDGYYFLINYKGGGEVNKEVDHLVKVTDGIMRHSIIAAEPKDLLPPKPESEEVEIKLPDLPAGRQG
jgi:small subunit ribosomal protein S6